MSSDSPVASAQAELDAFLHDSTHIDPACIHDEYVELPGQLAFWGQRLADARYEADDAVFQFERAEAHVMTQTRTNLELAARVLADGRSIGKKPVAPTRVTDSVVEIACKTDPRWASARKAVITTKHQVARLQAVVNAVEAKLTSLVSLGSHIRAEMSSGIVLRNPNLGANSESSGRSGE